MKKGVKLAVLFVTCLLISVILVTGFVSANWFTDLFKPKDDVRLSGPPGININFYGLTQSVNAVIEIRDASTHAVLLSETKLINSLSPTLISGNILDKPIYIYIKGINGYKDWSGGPCSFTLPVSGGVIEKNVHLELSTDSGPAVTVCSKVPRWDLIVNAPDSTDNNILLQVYRSSNKNVPVYNAINATRGAQFPEAFWVSFSRADITGSGPFYVIVKYVNGYKEFNGRNCPFSVDVSPEAFTLKTINLEAGTGITQCGSTGGGTGG